MLKSQKSKCKNNSGVNYCDAGGGEVMVKLVGDDGGSGSGRDAAGMVVGDDVGGSGRDGHGDDSGG